MKTVIMTLLLVGALTTAHAFQTEASYYTVASCRREGTSGIMANGKELKDDMLICASWDYPFGQRLLITNVSTGKSVVCVVSDRGPNKKLYKRGRRLDLSLAAFNKIANYQQGTVQVIVEVVK